MISAGVFEGLHWRWGPVDITGSIVTTWIVMLLLVGIARLSTLRLARDPEGLQVALEVILETLEDAIEGVLPGKVALVFPFLATLWILVFVSNLFGLIPGMESPTADLSITLSLSVIVFFSVHWFGIRDQGLLNYLKHFLSPNPVLLPFHLISEVSRTIALAVRLFGNVMSLEIAALLALMVAGLLVPIPLLLLHIVEALIQAYLFGMLALIYIAGGMQSQEIQKQKRKEKNIYE